MPYNIVGIKYWMPLHWTCFIFLVTFLGEIIITFIIGYKVPGWPLVMIANAYLIFFGIFRVEWPGRDGFPKEKNES
jgi:hypothetical protein